MLMHGSSRLQVGRPAPLESRRPIPCGAKAKKPAGKAAGKGFGSSAPAAAAPQRRRGLELQLLDELPPVQLDSDSDINPGTRDTCLFFMNKTEELCGRLPKVLDHAWAQATAQRIEDCVSRPVALTLPGHTASLHVLDITHDDLANPAILAAVWERVRPDAVALDVQSPYTKSFNRMAKAMDAQLLSKLMAAPLTSLSGALNHADDFDRLRWHHAILQVVGQGASPISVDEAALVNVFANRDLHLSECIAAAHLAAGGGPASGGPDAAAVLVHGVDMENDAMLSKTLKAMDEDDFWSEKDALAYRQVLLQVVEPQLRSAINTWLQGIPAGTSSTTPRQRFILTRLEQALSLKQVEAFQVADSAWRSTHPDKRVGEQQQLRSTQSAHLLSRLRDIANGRLGGRKCGRVLAVVGGGHALRIRGLAAAAAAAAAAASEGGVGGADRRDVGAVAAAAGR